MRQIFYTLLCLFFIQNLAFSQEFSAKKRITRLDAGYAAGVSGDSYFYVANQGVVGSVAHGLQWEKLAVLGGVGFESYDDVHFIPFFMELSKPFGKQKNSDFRVRLGYATGFSTNEVEQPEYHFDGGAFIQTGVGIPILQQDNFNLKLRFDYKYQHAQFLFQPFDGVNRIQTRLYYHFGSLKVAVEF
jgi:hypothetical protein